MHAQGDQSAVEGRRGAGRRGPGVIDVLARMQLTARRLGRSIRLRHACPEVQELLRLAGLADVMPVISDLPVDPER
jgi:hypothetical protein